jgi:D-alanyl-D-alanine dipeptidase
MNVLAIAFTLFSGLSMAQVPSSFVSLGEICPTLIIAADYATAENFTGSIVAGYKAKKAYLARETAQALCKVQEAAVKRGFGLKIYDGYRPVKAVSFFQSWAREPEQNPEIKARHYPKFTRHELFEGGYIAKESSHSRGSAVDLTLVVAETGHELDMGSIFDYFDDISHTDSKQVTSQQRKNRLLLKELMEAHGFKNFAQEWWHYSLKPEPHANEYFDFDVE